MNKLKKGFATILMLVTTLTVWSAEPKILYQNDFEKADVDKVPDDFLVLDGDFSVKQTNGNKYLELPGAPTDSFGVMFGPAVKDNVVVSARINGTKKGRRFPVFGVGLNGQGQYAYRLQVSPAKKELEIFKGDESVANVPYEWKSGEWTMLVLRITKSGAAWKVEGKAWTQGTAEPPQMMVSYDETNEPTGGRPSIWGSPISTTPIQFDDLMLKEAEAK